MFSRLTLAAGALAVGSLAFVGAGTFASYTGSDTLKANITSGTFNLTAVPGTPAVSLNNGQTLDAGTLPTTTGHNNTLTYTLTNADPGHTYTIPFTVFDTGSLPGEINSIQYVAPMSPNQLASDLTIKVCFISGSGCKALFTPNVAGQSSSTLGSASATFDTTGGDVGLTNFIGSNPTMGNTATGGGQASQGYEIVETFNASDNGAQGQSTNQTFTINGINQ